MTFKNVELRGYDISRLKKAFQQHENDYTNDS